MTSVGFFDFSLRDLEDQLVVNLQDHPRLQFLAPQSFIHAQHRQFDDVAGGTLHRHVDGFAFGARARAPLLFEVGHSRLRPKIERTSQPFSRALVGQFVHIFFDAGVGLDSIRR